METLKRSNSTSSIFVDSTPEFPNSAKLIRAMAKLIYVQTLEDSKNPKIVNKNSALYFLDEEKYIEELPQLFNESKKKNIRAFPSCEHIEEFVKSLFDCANFSPECIIISVIYIFRLISLQDIILTTTVWRPLVFTSFIVAQKVWDDKYLSNSDFSYIYPFFESAQVNQMETKFLELLQYDTFVTQKLYYGYFIRMQTALSNDVQPEQLNLWKKRTLEDKFKEVKRDKPRAKSTGKQVELRKNTVFSIS